MAELTKSDQEFAYDINKEKDPRRLKCLALWRDPTSDTFGNLKRSAIIAGFSEDYADTLSVVNPSWISESAKADIRRVKRAESNLDNVLHVDIDFQGEKYDIDLARLQIDVSKTILKAIAKTKWDSEGEKVNPSFTVNIVNYNDTKEPDTSNKSVKEAEIVE